MIIGFAFLGLAWVFANPPGAAPDEPTTYTRAMATAFGQLRPTALPAAPPSASARARFNSISVGRFHLPARYVADPRWGCANIAKGAAATCVDAPLPKGATGNTSHEVRVDTYVAFYPPAVFLLLGAGARLAPSAHSALYVGRLVSLALCVSMLAIAFAVTKGRWALIGLLAAVSPMAVFLASTFNPTGVEVAAGIGFSAVVVALARGESSRLVWFGFLASGVLLAVARPLGFLWIVMDVGLLVILVGPRRLLWRFRRDSPRSRVAASVVTLAALSTVAWDAIVGHSPRASTSQALRDIGDSIHQLRATIDQFVGIFGWQDVPLPHGITQVALAIYVVLIASALVAGRWRASLLLVGFGAGVFLVAVVLDAAVEIPFGFGVAARFLMPVSGMILVLAGSLIDRRLSAGQLAQPRSRWRWPERSARWSSPIALLFAGGLSILQLVGWVTNSRVAAGGIGGSWSFVTHARWVPPGGWTLWIVFAAGGTLLLMVGVVTMVLATPTLDIDRVVTYGLAPTPATGDDPGTADPVSSSGTART